MCEFVTWVEQLPHATDWKKFEIVIHFLSFPHVILGQKPAKSTFFSCDATEDLKNHYQTDVQIVVGCRGAHGATGSGSC